MNRKNFILSILAIALIVFAGCKKTDVIQQAPPAPKFNPITITTVAGPTKTGCGGFEWDVTFKLGAKSVKGGWIVQKITMNRYIVDCRDKVIEDSKLTYWEAWHIMPGSDIDSARAEGLFTYDDKYKEPDHPDTKGKITFEGEVKFFEGLSLPDGFIRNNPDTYAGGLPSTKTKPGFWDNTDAVPHTLISKWNCCVHPGNQTVQTWPVTQ